MLVLLTISDAIKRRLETVAFVSGWLLVVLAAITCFDVLCRKFGIPIPLTKFQELEWHAHCALFSLWMGYNYTINAHPRVDSYTETLGFRVKAWIEFIGCVVFAIPFMGLMIWFGWDFFWTSFLQNESSEHAIGLPYRWAIKGVFYVGLILVLAGVISVWLRLVAYLFGGRTRAETDLQIGHAELEA
ncbi:MAG: TRAP transporter small permease subunit [Alphaproteobacteria bacterium]|nr:TRAP transporter small permease subunit [Alphaproteobacteria bacterium]MCW5743022.1 TRAP transporter small permease subunit [Alphaproteobacteria bacterium]